MNSLINKKAISVLGQGGILVSSMILTASCSSGEKKESIEKPNIIFVLVDQLRHDRLGYSGDAKAHTPNIDKLAAQSVNFSNAVAVSPVSAPMRASLLTGKYTSSNGMVINEIRINPNQRSIAHVLNENEYETAYIGKWHLWANEAGKHNEAKNAFIPKGPHRLGFDGEWKAYNFHHNNYNAYYFEDEPKKIFYGDSVYEPEAQFNFGMDFIDKASKSKNPFALFLSIGIPHDPWSERNVPEKYLKLFENSSFTLPDNWLETPDKYMDRFTNQENWTNNIKKSIPKWDKVYYAMVASLDDYMGRLMKKIDELGISDNTILVFTSDHGEMAGENGRIQKMIFYDAAARVPFLIRWPGKIISGSKNNVCLNTPDIMPTILSLLNLPIPEEVEGVDLSHHALGTEGFEPELAFMQGMGHTYLWIDGSEWRAVRNKRYTYARYLIDGKELLFDNLKDPKQTINLSDEPDLSGIKSLLKGSMAKKMRELNDEFKPCTWYRDNWTDGNRNIISSAKGDF